MVISDIEKLLEVVDEWRDACNHVLASGITAEERNAIVLDACRDSPAWETPARMQMALLAKCDEMRYARVTESHRLRQLLERERDVLLEKQIQEMMRHE